MAAQVVSRKEGEGQALWVLGGLYEVLVSGDESDGAVTVVKMTLPAGTGPPPHTHAGAEFVHVIDGEMTAHIGDEAVAGSPGSSFFYPAGTREWIEAETQCTVLVTYIPGGIDRFFLEAGERAPAHTLPPPSDTPPDVERLAAIGARYGLMIETG